MTLRPVALLPSLARAPLRAFVRAGIRPWFGRLPFRLERVLFGAITAVQLVPSGTTFARVWMRGVPAERSRNVKRRREDAILYLHGGAYYALAPRSFRGLLGRLARAAAADVFAIDYRLAPEHPYPAAFDDTLDAYRWLLREGYAAERIAFVADSAGGGLALAALLHLRGADSALPAAAAFISPWIDSALGVPVDAALAASDPLLPGRVLERGAGACNPPVDDARTLAGLPPFFVIAGSDDALLGDAERLIARARADGVPAEGIRYDGLWHDFTIHAGWLPEADHAVASIAAFLQATCPYGFGSKSSASEFMQKR